MASAARSLPRVVVELIALVAVSAELPEALATVALVLLDPEPSINSVNMDEKSAEVADIQGSFVLDVLDFTVPELAVGDVPLSALDDALHGDCGEPGRVSPVPDAPLALEATSSEPDELIICAIMEAIAAPIRVDPAEPLMVEVPVSWALDEVEEFLEPFDALLAAARLCINCSK